MIEYAWAKLDGDRALPLVDHAADVSAVFAALLDAGWSDRFARCLDRPLTPAEVACMCAAAHLHDLGKANAGFWRRQDQNARRVGHLKEVLACPNLEMHLGAYIEGFGANLFWAMLAHHGRPVPRDAALGEDAGYWHPADRYDPIAQLNALLDRTQTLFPLQSVPDEPLPPRAAALFAGLLTLADWIGSSARRFKIDGVTGPEREARSCQIAGAAIQSLGLGRDASMRAAAGVTFEAAFGFAPRGLQATAGEGGGRLTILEAETGSGKTEAALWRFLQLFAAGKVDGLYLALPTRTSAVQMHGRIGRVLERVFGAAAPPATLAVPGYLKAGDAEGTRLTGWDVLWSDDPADAARDARWSAEQAKQFLAARVAVGTVDQILLSGLRVRHAHLRAACLSRSLLVVDEVHASDAYMTEVLSQVLENHLGAGGHAMLLSATLGIEARLRLSGERDPDPPPLAEAECLPYPALHGVAAAAVATGPDKVVTLELAGTIENAPAIAERALKAACDGARVLVIRNTVGGAIAVQEALEKSGGPLWHVGDVPALHHGRFAAEDRKALDEGIETAFGKARSAGGLIAVGTQTLEISLDLDADLMITDLAPMDVLLQRLGRLHRHPRDRPSGFEAPRAVILTPADRDLTPFLGRVGERHGLGPSTDTMAGVYPDLAALEATWSTLEGRAALYLPSDNRILVERSLHPEALECVVAAKEWRTFDARRRGARSADRRLAQNVALDMSIPFADLDPFPDAEETIGTRLGARDLLLRLPLGTPGAFGPATQIRVPSWLARDVPVDVEPEIESQQSGFSLTLPNEQGSVILTYDRWGLRKI